MDYTLAEEGKCELYWMRQIEPFCVYCRKYGHTSGPRDNVLDRNLLAHPSRVDVLYCILLIYRKLGVDRMSTSSGRHTITTFALHGITTLRIVYANIFRRITSRRGRPSLSMVRRSVRSRKWNFRKLEWTQKERMKFPLI